jgi:FERM N-terminal domain
MALIFCSRVCIVLMNNCWSVIFCLCISCYIESGLIEDNADCMKICICLQKQSKGQVLLDKVFEHLELVEKDYFGLQYSDSIQTEHIMVSITTRCYEHTCLLCIFLTTSKLCAV